MKFSTEVYPNYTLVEFDLEGGIAAPEMLESLKVPEVDGTRGVVISGKGPIWLYCAIAHEYHATAWTATHDPRLGHVVFATHSKLAKVGEVIKPNEPIII